MNQLPVQPDQILFLTIFSFTNILNFLVRILHCLDGEHFAEAGMHSACIVLVRSFAFNRESMG
jgi:hypothetical protein